VRPDFHWDKSGAAELLAIVVFLIVVFVIYLVGYGVGAV
jgi:hypothetical protein